MEKKNYGNYQSEADFIEALKSGENEAFEILDRLYRARMLSFANLFLHNHQEKEDAVQELWLKVFQKIHRFKVKASLSTWMFRILKNICLDRNRKRKVRKTDMTISIDPVYTVLTNPNESPFKIFEKKELREKVIQGARHLNDRKAGELIILRFFQGLRSNEAADILGINPNTAKIKVFRAIMELRKKIAVQRRSFSTSSVSV